MTSYKAAHFPSLVLPNPNINGRYYNESFQSARQTNNEIKTKPSGNSIRCWEVQKWRIGFLYSVSSIVSRLTNFEVILTREKLGPSAFHSITQFFSPLQFTAHLEFVRLIRVSFPCQLTFLFESLRIFSEWIYLSFYTQRIHYI